MALPPTLINTQGGASASLDHLYSVGAVGGCGLEYWQQQALRHLGHSALCKQTTKHPHLGNRQDQRRLASCGLRLRAFVELRVHDGRVAALRPRARHGTVAGTVVVQGPLREAAARNRHRGADSNVATDQEGAVLGEGAELGQDLLTAGNKLRAVLGGDVRGEELRDTGHLDGRTPGHCDLRNALVRLADRPVALRFVV